MTIRRKYVDLITIPDVSQLTAINDVVGDLIRALNQWPGDLPADVIATYQTAKRWHESQGEKTVVVTQCDELAKAFQEAIKILDKENNKRRAQQDKEWDRYAAMKVKLASEVEAQKAALESAAAARIAQIEAIHKDAEADRAEAAKLLRSRRNEIGQTDKRVESAKATLAELRARIAKAREAADLHDSHIARKLRKLAAIYTEIRRMEAVAQIIANNTADLALEAAG